MARTVREALVEYDRAKREFLQPIPGSGLVLSQRQADWVAEAIRVNAEREKK